MKTVTIFDIERNSYVDGPGIRTTVFFKGCNLRCAWCHNPESQSPKPQMMFYKNKCTGCGKCKEKCPNHSESCELCGKCTLYCPHDAREICGKEYTVDEAMREILKDKTFYENSGGGVTFSGGEPTASSEFLLECLSILKGKTNRAIQTCGYCDLSVFKQILANCDYMLFDIKIVDEDMHKRYTGVSNAVILENFRTLAASGKPFVIRVPLIPTVTDTEDNTRRIARLLSENGVKYAELLPYNKMAGSKYQLVGKSYTPSFDQSVPARIRTEIFEAYGIQTKVI